MKIAQQLISSIALAVLSTVFADIAPLDKRDDPSSRYDEPVNAVSANRKLLTSSPFDD